MAEQKRFAGVPAGFQVQVKQQGQRLAKLEDQHQKLLLRMEEVERHRDVAPAPRRGRRKDTAPDA